MVDKEDSLGECELDIGILLLHFMRVVFYNSHEVREGDKKTLFWGHVHFQGGGRPRQLPPPRVKKIAFFRQNIKN